MPITELIQPTAPNALLTFNGGPQTLGFTSGAVGTSRVAIATSTDLASTLTHGVAWWLPGAAGSPWLLGYGRFDVTGGAGNDSLGAGILGALDDTIRGGAGDDAITGAAGGQDVLDGGAGRDSLAWSWAGLSTPMSLVLTQLSGSWSLGGTSISGFESYSLGLGDGADTIDARGYQDTGTFSGGAGDDLVIADHTTNGARFLDGAGYDTLRLDLSAVTTPVTMFVPVYGPFGGSAYPAPTFLYDDKRISLGTASLVSQDRGFVRYQVTEVPEALDIRLGHGADVIQLSRLPVAFVIFPRSGPPFMTSDGNLRNATLDGAAGNDILTAAPSHSTLLGGTGDDNLMGQGGNDLIDGGEGQDSLSGGTGNNTLDGGAGIDIWSVLGSRDTPLRLNAPTAQTTRLGTDLVRNVENVQVEELYNDQRGAWVIGDAQANQIWVTATNGALRLEGMAGDDTLSGGAGHDELLGGAGHDSLSGGDGRDRLAGDDGNDTLVGGAGHDTLLGGGGVNLVTGNGGHDILIIDGARRAGSLVIAMDAPIADGLSGASFSVHGSFTGPRETTSFSGIETLIFTDGRLAFDPGDPAMQVARLYETALNRAPNPFELNFWIDRLAEGMTLTRAGDIFAGGAEFAQVWGGLSNAAFISRLYANSVERAPNSFEASFWATQLNGGMSRGDVLTRLSEYHEARGVIGAAYANGIWDQDSASASIARLYQATLNRRPEEAGLRDWRAEMAAGKSLAELVPGFTGSVEFTTLYGATSNQAFVTLLYNNVLGRAPDAAGLAGWVAQLDAGGTRSDVVLGFSESLEFRLSTMGWIEGGITFA